jgi:UDP-glucuronate 4-epimerase
MDYGESAYEIINLGNNSTVGLLDMVGALEKALGVKAELAAQAPQPGDVPKTWADIGKAQGLLRWWPQTPFCEGIATFAEWAKERRFT